MNKIVLVSVFVLSAAGGWSCSGSSLKGSGPVAGDGAAAAGENLLSTPTPGVTATPTPLGTLVPDQVIDRMEAFTDPNKCLARAQQLLQKAGLTSDFSRTANFGFYKVPRSQGLCDIHFFSKLGVQIEDHEGKDSMLGNQVALYCPCNGPWAMTGSEYASRYLGGGERF